MRVLSCDSMALHFVLGETNYSIRPNIPQQNKISIEAKNTAILLINQPIAAPENPILLP
jgi:hypothetical protein